MKVEEKKKSRELRKEGKSLKEITDLLGVAKSSVSLWVRDIILTSEQKQKLLEKNPVYYGQCNGSKKIREKYLKIRKNFQEEGKLIAKKRDWLFVAGCMLYWGEGFKNKNTCGIANSDPHLLKLFLKFLYKHFYIKKEEIEIRIQGYLDNDKSIIEHEKYWINILKLNRSNIRRAQIDLRPRSSVHKGKGRILKYGICRLIVNRTDIVQKIFGAIQEFGNFLKPEWLG